MFPVGNVDGSPAGKMLELRGIPRDGAERAAVDAFHAMARERIEPRLAVAKDAAGELVTMIDHHLAGLRDDEPSAHVSRTDPVQAMRAGTSIADRLASAISMAVDAHRDDCRREGSEVPESSTHRGQRKNVGPER